MPLEIVQLGRKAFLDCRYSKRFNNTPLKLPSLITSLLTAVWGCIRTIASHARCWSLVLQLSQSAWAIVPLSGLPTSTALTAPIKILNCDRDLLVMGGCSRLAYHGVMKIFPHTCPSGVQMRSAGRISVTIRQVHPISSSVTDPVLK